MEREQTGTEIGSEWVDLGSKLRAARERAGFRQEDVARLVSISRPTVSAMEAGKTRIDGLLLSRMAKLYRQDIESFFDEAIEPPQVEQLLLSRLGDLSPKDKAAVAASLESCSDLNFLRDLLKYPRKELPGPHPLQSGARKYAAEVAAEQERSRLGLGAAPIGDRLFGILDVLGLPVFRIPLEDTRISGYLIDHPQAGPVIFVNSSQYHWRQVFTAAHEYGHFLFHRSTQPIACRIFADDGGTSEGTSEALINAFASEFLMPKEGIEHFLVAIGAHTSSLDPEAVVRLQRHFGVSFQAMLYRLLRLRLITSAETVQRMIAEVRPVEVAWRLGYPVSKEELGESTDGDDAESLVQRLPTTYVEMAIDAFEKGLISNGRAAELTGLNRGAFDDFYHQRRLAREAQQVEVGLEHVVA